MQCRGLPHSTHPPVLAVEWPVSKVAALPVCSIGSGVLEARACTTRCVTLDDVVHSMGLWQQGSSQSDAQNMLDLRQWHPYPLQSLPLPNPIRFWIEGQPSKEMHGSIRPFKR